MKNLSHKSITLTIKKLLKGTKFKIKLFHLKKKKKSLE